MENATKALIIAGAVLITILLISIGIAIFSSSNGTEKNVEKVSNSMSVATFNAQFTNYIGNNLTSEQVKVLISNIITSNKNNTPKVRVKGFFSLVDEGIESWLKVPGEGTYLEFNLRRLLSISGEYRYEVKPTYIDGYLALVDINIQE